MPKPQQKRTPAQAKQPIKRIPNLPQHNLPEPYAQLTVLGEGEFPDAYETIATKLLAGDSIKEIDTLIEIASDGKWYEYVDFDTFPPDKDPFVTEARLSTPLHALCVLTQMGEAVLPRAERLLPLFCAEDDALAEEVGYFFGSLGEPVLPLLEAHLRDAESDPNIRAGVAESLKLMVETHPELQEQCIALLSAALPLEEHPEVAVYLITALMDLGAEDAYPLIEEAYLQERVDDSLLSLAEVQSFFEMPITLSEEAVPTVPDASVEEVQTPEEVRTPFVSEKSVGRNDPCPCGSGKKYKKCCGA